MRACVHGLPFAQVRAISNVVERRNRDAWKLTEAIREPRRGRAATCWVTHDAVARILAVPERLLHVRRDRPSPHRSRGARVHRAAGGHRGAERGRRSPAQADVTKLSFHAYAYCAGDYVLLDAGSALGRNCGPLLISKRRDLAATRSRAGGLTHRDSRQVHDREFPARRWRFLARTDKTELLFSAIEAAVLDGSFDAGLIIHENRFTYAGEGAQEDHRPRRVLGRRDRRADSARRHRRQARAAGRRAARR